MGILSSSLPVPPLTTSLASLLNDSQLEYISGLGSSRFLRTLKAKKIRNEASFVITKVFIKPDLQMSLEKYSAVLNEYKSLLSQVPNTLPYQEFKETDKTAYITRPYIIANLYDRISTRPFLSLDEKKWIAFQILTSLAECHMKGICHGDIKLENVLVTSWNWIYLTDFAPYKPTFIPEDDPTDFSYFFDSSLRRSCYLSPERLCKTSQISSSLESPDISGITPQMDIFSVGCVIAELFLEGSPIFNFSKLIQYRNGEFDPSSELLKIEDAGIRKLVRDMIQVAADKRLNAFDYLSRWKDSFPPCFHSLHDYIFRNLEIDVRQDCVEDLEVVNKIDRLHADLDIIYSILDKDGENSAQNLEIGCLILFSYVASHLEMLTEISSIVKAIYLLLTFGFHLSDSLKLDRVTPFLVHYLSHQDSIVRARAIDALSRLLETIQFLRPEDSLIFPQLILPKTISLVSDPRAVVRISYASCMSSLAKSSLKFLQNSQCSSPEKGDHSDLEFEYDTNYSYESKYQELQEMIQDHVIHLLIDPSSEVKEAILTDITSLCMFFGRQKANDFLLSHMITFLNDRDPNLRASFFESIVGMGVFLGRNNLQQFILPLMIQSLHDEDELVIDQVLTSLIALAELEMFPKMKLHEIIIAIRPLVLHPNPYLRRGAINFISKACQNISILDLHALILPLLEPYLDFPTANFEADNLNEHFLSPLSEELFERGKKFAYASRKILKVRDSIDEEMNESLDSEEIYLRRGKILVDFNKYKHLIELDGISKQNQKKLELIKDYLLWFDPSLKASKGMPASWDRELELAKDENGTIHLESMGIYPKVYVVQPDNQVKISVDNAAIHGHMRASSYPNQDKNTQASPQSTGSISQDWQEVLRHTPSDQSFKYSESSKQRAKPKFSNSISLLDKDKNASKSTAIVGQSDEVASGQLEQLFKSNGAEKLTKSVSDKFEKMSISVIEPKNEYVSPEIISYLKEKAGFSPVVVELGKKARHPKRRTKISSARGLEISNLGSWRPQGLLVGSFEEHKAAVNKLAISPDHGFLVSCSDDGNLKLWDCKRFEKNISNRSRLTYSIQGRWTDVLFGEGTRTFLSSSDRNFVDFIHVDHMSSQKGPVKYGKPQRIHRIFFNEEYPVCMAHSYDEKSSVLILGMSSCNIIGWDIRSNRELWRLKSPPHYGAITSITCDPHFNWIASGTRKGVVIIWDPKTLTALKTWAHPSRSTVHKIKPQNSSRTSYSKRLICACGNNELSVWDIDKGEYRELFVARPINEKIGRYMKQLKAVPPPTKNLSENMAQFNSDSCGIGTKDPFHEFRTFVSPFGCPFYITGGTDSQIRFWDISREKKSYLISDTCKNYEKKFSSYKSNSLLLHHEKLQKSNPSDAARISSSSPFITALSAPSIIKGRATISSLNQWSLYQESNYNYHIDAITDLQISEVPYPLLFSSGRDGCIKVWK